MQRRGSKGANCLEFKKEKTYRRRNGRCRDGSVFVSFVSVAAAAVFSSLSTASEPLASTTTSRIAASRVSERSCVAGQRRPGHQKARVARKTPVGPPPQVVAGHAEAALCSGGSSDGRRRRRGRRRHWELGRGPPAAGDDSRPRAADARAREGLSVHSCTEGKRERRRGRERRAWKRANSSSSEGKQRE